MKSYFQGLITGGVLVFSFLVLTGQAEYQDPRKNIRKLSDNVKTANARKVNRNLDKNINYPVGKYIYGMESMNDDFYYAWITDTQTGEVVIRKVQSLKLKDEKIYSLSWKGLVDKHNNQ